jgi:hypothetical protein
VHNRNTYPSLPPSLLPLFSSKTLRKNKQKKIKIKKRHYNMLCNVVKQLLPSLPPSLYEHTNFSLLFSLPSAHKLMHDYFTKLTEQRWD